MWVTMVENIVIQSKSDFSKNHNFSNSSLLPETSLHKNSAFVKFSLADHHFCEVPLRMRW